MSTITDHGGDVLRLAGDALIVAFTGKSKCSNTEPPGAHVAARPAWDVCEGVDAKRGRREGSVVTDKLVCWQSPASIQFRGYALRLA